MVNPVPGFKVTTAFWKAGSMWSLGRHTGCDISGTGVEGKTIVAGRPGKIIAANAYDKAYGYKVIIQVGSEQDWYCHMPSGGAKVRVGQTVTAGQAIGKVGRSGNVTGPHLHLERRAKPYTFAASTFRDPSAIINYAAASTVAITKENVEYSVTATVLNGRSGPGTSHPIKATAKKGAKITSVGWVKVGSTVWVKNTGGNWWSKDHLAVRTYPTVVDKTVYEVTATPSLSGRTYPVGGDIKGSPKTGAIVTAVARTKDKQSDGSCWVKNISGLWFSAKYLKAKVIAPAPVPPAPVAKSVTLNIGTLNVIRWRLGTTNPRGVADQKKGLDYKDRLAGLGKIQDAMGVSVLVTQESGTYADADALSKALGTEWKNVLHGDNGDLTNAVHWHSKRKMLAEGKFETSGAHHNWATWTLLQDVKSGVVFLVVTTHLEYRTRGTTSASEWDKIRGAQTRALIAGGKKVAAAEAVKRKLASIPIVWAADFNQDDDDNFDTPGDEFTKAGYVDVESLTPNASGPETTLNGMDPKRVTGRRVDRVFVPKGTKVTNLRTVAGYPYTDHNGVAISVTLTN